MEMPGGSGSESTHVLSSIGTTEMAFDDGAVVVAMDGTPVRGVMHAAHLYGSGPAQIRRGGTWSGKFRVQGLSPDVPVDITLIGREVKVISGRTFQAARLGVQGFASRDISPGTPSPTGGGSMFRGEMLVDTATGLVLATRVTCRHPSYEIQREIVRISGT